MAKLNISGREVVLPLYSINIMNVAGPFMDEIFKVMQADALPNGFTELNSMMQNLTGFIAAGAVKVDPELTQERLGDVYSMGDAALLQAVVADIFADLGVDMKGTPLPAPQVGVAAKQPEDPFADAPAAPQAPADAGPAA